MLALARVGLSLLEHAGVSTVLVVVLVFVASLKLAGGASGVQPTEKGTRHPATH